ncbi:MAG: RagB/SusD family nutrient uptake outer membrane protein [Pedobacter sp.]|nr:MAG: RagB/SusD family nutrient uptake outer membrane protein [Pedobacter sp.]
MLYRSTHIKTIGRIKWKALMVLNFSLVLLFASCKKLIEIPAPENEIIRSAVFSDKGTAEAAMAGIYNKLVNSGAFGGSFGSLTMLEGAYADELVSYGNANSPVTAFYANSIVNTNSSVASIWSSSYNIIYSANAVVEGLDGSKGIQEALKRQLKGESLFLRAFMHFYLVNIFGAVPYIKTTDYEANSKVTSTPVDELYSLMIEDLLEAKDLLVNEYPSTQRVRINKGAATALLARAYLYSGKWAEAEVQSTELINNKAQYELLNDLNTVFLKNSKEAIWQLIPVFQTTNEGQLFILVAPPTFVAMNHELAESFDATDKRKQNWIGVLTSGSGFSKWHYPFKYKEKNNGTGAEYSMVLRMAEQYVIRAEARAEQGKLTGNNSAETDINSIRNRAGLGNTTATTKAQLITAIEQERKWELFTEMGHRFFDLKRLGRLDAVLDPIKPNWEPTDALLPIPQSELLSNPNLNN